MVLNLSLDDESDWGKVVIFLLANLFAGLVGSARKAALLLVCGQKCGLLQTESFLVL